MKKLQKPNVKNTKTEILEAYETLLKEVKQNDEPAKEAQNKANDVVKEAVSENMKSIINQIAGLKVQVSQSLEDLSKDLLSERAKLGNLQEAIIIQTKYLEEVHNIKVNVDSFKALLLAQERKKEEFEEWINSAKEKFSKEMSEKKESWQKEQEKYESEQKEKRELEKKEKQRQKDEYEYQLKMIKQKDQDEYQQKKLLQERELAEKKKLVELECSKREEEILGKEEELKNLRKYKEQAEKNLVDSLSNAEEKLRKELQAKYENQLSIKNKEYESENALLKQNIKFLESKITDQEKIIISLSKQLADSNSQSQDLAKKIIEGNTNLYIQEMRNKNNNLVLDKANNND